MPFCARISIDAAACLMDRYADSTTASGDPANVMTHRFAAGLASICNNATLGTERIASAIASIAVTSRPSLKFGTHSKIDFVGVITGKCTVNGYFVGLMNWITHPLTFEGDLVRLEPMEAAHLEMLAIAANDARIWEHQVIDGTQPNTLMQSLREALLKRTYGEQFPFTIIDKRSGNLIGSTRFFEIYAQHRKLEIGWTWINPNYWGRGHNAEVKLLMLTYCFEKLQTVRVQIKTRVSNERSLAAIRKLGAAEEGTLRNDRILPNGQVRDTVLFSIIPGEWPAIKALLQARVAAMLR